MLNSGFLFSTDPFSGGGRARGGPSRGGRGCGSDGGGHHRGRYGDGGGRRRGCYGDGEGRRGCRAVPPCAPTSARGAATATAAACAHRPYCPKKKIGGSEYVKRCGRHHFPGARRLTCREDDAGRCPWARPPPADDAGGSSSRRPYLSPSRPWPARRSLRITLVRSLPSRWYSIHQRLAL
jgi:hypothetical protein